MSRYQFPAFDELVSIPELPDPFMKADGTRISSVEEWPEQREYLKAMLAHYMYGEAPEAPGNTVGEVISSRYCYAGKAIAESVRITFGPGLSFVADVLRPAVEGKVPVITWNQFKDRHGCPDEEDVVLRRGYAVIEFEKEQLCADDCTGIVGPLASAYPGYSWGEIAMWGWLQSRVIDYLETTDYADMSKIVATGHSRGGKVALYCGIYDDRVAVTAPNASGCGGVGCFRFLGGRMGEGTAICETAGSMSDAFPFWWCDEFEKFGHRTFTWTRSDCQNMGDLTKAFTQMDTGVMGREDLMPFDLHFCRAVIAPRAIISTDAMSDNWANTFGTHVSWVASQEVFDFLGVPHNNAMHMRDGGHRFQAIDWHAIADFCDEILMGKMSDNNIVFAPTAPDPENAMAQAMANVDWRCRDKLHYAWRNPKAE